MAALGIEQVRLGEFAWSRIEPAAGAFDWDWLDRAIDVLAAEKLDVILCTPTATPPKWLIDAHPEILACDEEGRPRKFGSRRHYCFSSPRYREETERIVTAIGERYGDHEAVVAWQLDNEYGCHETVRSYSDAANAAFRLWLEQRYGDIGALNRAWGAVFWSQEYAGFQEIELPNLTVTEPNPSHVFDFYRFSSDQVIHYNRLQANILRRLSPGRDLTHNVMGFFFDFDHFELGADLDFVAWDSYPIGFLDVSDAPELMKRRYMRQGHPDFAAFHHDLYRSCGRGRWQVIEQQPGPVNWAQNNPAPAPGMVRLWTLEAAAHGAEAVSYFRWRQAPFAQEQMHAGLKRVDNRPAKGFEEAKTAAADFKTLRSLPARPAARVALLFDYEARWMFEAHPHGNGWSYEKIAFDWYRALRRGGLPIDIISKEMEFSNYDVVWVPSAPIIDSAFSKTVRASRAQFLFGPRSGTKTADLHVCADDASPSRLLPTVVEQAESFPSFHRERAVWNGRDVAGATWLDHVAEDIEPLVKTGEDNGLLYRRNNIWSATTVPEEGFLDLILEEMAKAAKLDLNPVPDGLRVARSDAATFVINYDLEPHVYATDDERVIGSGPVNGADAGVWRKPSA